MVMMMNNELNGMILIFDVALCFAIAIVIVGLAVAWSCGNLFVGRILRVNNIVLARIG